MKLPADTVVRLRAFYEGRVVCVTGGAGFIGGHLCDALLSLGATVRVIDDLTNSSLEHLSSLIELEPDRVRFVHGSILDDDALRQTMEGVQTVFHLAALGSVPRSIEQPQRTWSVNATGTLRVLEAARVARSQRVVFAASSSAYGDQPELPKVESQLPRPRSPYAASKVAGEHLLSVWSQCYGLSTVSLRYFNVFGPRQSPDSAYAAVVAAFAKALLAGEAPAVYGDGSQSRDFTFVGNAVLATMLAGASTAKLSGQVVNVATGVRTTVNELAELMARVCGAGEVQAVHRPERAGDVLHSVADLGLSRQLLGYEPVASLQDGLNETMQWYKRALAGSRA